VESWKRLWTYFINDQDEKKLSTDTSEILEILRLFCRHKTPSTNLLNVDHQPMDTTTSTLDSNLNDINRNAINESILYDLINDVDGPLKTRYDVQASFMVIRTKKWIKRHRRKWTDDACDVINLLAPNKETTLQHGTTFRHDVSKGAIDIVRLMDMKAMKIFDIAKYGSGALRKLIMEMTTDVGLMQNLKTIIEATISSTCEDELIEYLLHAFVIGSSSSLGKYVMRTVQIPSKSSEFVVSLRSDLRVLSKKGNVSNTVVSVG